MRKPYAILAAALIANGHSLPTVTLTTARERRALINVLRAAVAAFPALAAVPTIAGQCPPDKLMADATKPNATPAHVLAAIDLAEEPAKIENRTLRLQRG